MTVDKLWEQFGWIFGEQISNELRASVINGRDTHFSWRIGAPTGDGVELGARDGDDEGVRYGLRTSVMHSEP